MSYDLTGVINLNEQYLKNIGSVAVTEAGTGVAADLQSTLDSIRGNLVSLGASSLNTVTQQKNMLDIVTRENERLNRKANAIDDNLSSKRRAIELNESYRKKQQYYTYILLVVILAIALSIVASLFVPESVKDLVFIIIVAIAIIVIMKLYYVIAIRDNTNFDKLHSISPVSPATTDLNKQNNNAKSQMLRGPECVGSSCCPDNTKYSTLLNQCIPTATASTTNNKYDPSTLTFVASCPANTTAQDDTTLGYKVCVAPESFRSMGTAGSAQPYTPFEFNSYSKL